MRQATGERRAAENKGSHSEGNCTWLQGGGIVGCTDPATTVSDGPWYVCARIRTTRERMAAPTASVAQKHTHALALGNADCELVGGGAGE